MDHIDLDALEAIPLTREPFEYLVVPGFIDSHLAAEARAGFPDIRSGGLVPAWERGLDSRLKRLLDGLNSDSVRLAFSRKFKVDLAPETLLVTLRGRCRFQDGQIHTDSESKLITALIYLNEPWEAVGGRLRLLRSKDNIEDVIAEVPPTEGTLIAFRRSDHSFHGHKPYEGIRRVVMLNWMVDARAAQRERLRHGVSALIKGFRPAVTIPTAAPE
jgi:hypothetical protein